MTNFSNGICLFPEIIIIKITNLQYRYLYSTYIHLCTDAQGACIISTPAISTPAIDEPTLAELKFSLPNYDIINHPRKTYRGGGICVLYRSTARCIVNHSHNCSSFELLDITIHLTPSSTVRVYCIYRPPQSPRHTFTSSEFLEEFLTLLESAAVDVHPPILLGDFNLHVDDPSDSFAQSFLNAVEALGFQQHVQGPTHRAGHTLDLVLSRKSEDIISHISLLSSLPSDHSAILSTINLKRPKNPKRKVTYRKLCDIDINSFRKDIKQILASSPCPFCPSGAVLFYNDSLSKLMDKHAPLKTVTVTIRPNAPWFSDEIRVARRHRRRAERRMLKSGLQIDKMLYRQECESYNSLITDLKSKYLRNEIATADSKQLFNIVKKLSTPNQSSIFPEHSSDSELANQFSEFFKKKISDIVSSFASDVTFAPSHVLHPETSLNCNLCEFIPVTEIQLRRRIKSTPPKACNLDPLPTWLLKDCLDELLPVLTNIINASLSLGVVPRSFRASLILPVLKKPNLDPNDFGNYRPIANLPFVSKVLERIVADQLMCYVDSHNLLPANQSAYRNFHSTETALLKVFNDILLAVDKGDEAVLLLLDFSAAFDTLDHTVLLQRLAKDYSITGTVLQWIESYLQDRTQKVIINGTCSAPSILSCGVPQGSVIGPLLFLLYTGPLAKIITSHQGVNYAMYADDTQIYTPFISSQ